MSNQPYGQQYGDSYEGYDPYQQQQQPPYPQQQQPQAQEWPGQQQGQGYDEAQAQAQQYTQQWQGQTWETQMQAPVVAAPAPVAEAPYVPPQANEGAAGAGYGPATIAGNARVTDAQRARLEGRSPIIEPGIQPPASQHSWGSCSPVRRPSARTPWSCPSSSSRRSPPRAGSG